MTDQQKSHLALWCENNIHAEHVAEAYWRIIDFVREYPELVESHTWSEIHSLAIRSEKEKI